MEVHQHQDEGLGGQTYFSQGLNHSYPYYSHVFDFEKAFDERVAQGWVQDNWVPVVAWAGSLYVVLVFSGQAWMASRPAFQLRGLLAAWSAFLAIFSIMGFARTLPEFIHTLTTGGLYKSICDTSFVETNKVSGYWTWLFTLSKMPELGDTVFIVLRKQQLIFLHWYHHLTVLIYVFYCFSQFTSCARWFMIMNYFVHSVMYSYYALKAMRVRVPRSVSMMITSLQLVQMVIGCAINYLAFQFKRSGYDCSVTDENLMYSSLMYASYFVLFARFFYNAYFSKLDRKRKDKLDGKVLNGGPVKGDNGIKNDSKMLNGGSVKSDNDVKNNKECSMDETNKVTDTSTHSLKKDETIENCSEVSTKDMNKRPVADEEKKFK